MPYVLKEITADDQDKIISDASRDSAKQRALIFAKKYGTFPETWAVDSLRGYYLLRHPSPELTTTLEKPFFAHIGGITYQVNTEGWVGHRVYFRDKALPSEPLLTELQNEVRAAFAVHGRFGKGPLNEQGLPEWAINAEFKNNNNDHLS